MLFSNIPLQEIKGRVILAGHGRVRQFIYFLRDQLLMLVGLAEQLVEWGIFGKRGGDSVDPRQAAGVG